MAKTSGLGQEIYVHGYDLSGDVSALDSVGSPREQIEVTAINKSARERINGLSDGTITINAWFNDAAGQEHAALSTLPTTDRIITWAAGGSIGDAAYSLNAKQVNYDGSRGTDGSLAFVVNAVGNGVAPDWCENLTAGSETHSSAGSSTSRDDSAATSAGLVGYLQIVSIGSGTPTVTIQQSSDNGSGDAWATVLSFSAVADGAEPTAERVTVSGAVERYLRVTTTGTFTNATFIVTTRRGTSEDDVTL